jgi:hypothetical protein
MKFSEIKPSALKKEEVDIDELIGKICTGKAILFTGAGFSIGTENVDSKAPPLANELAQSICQLGGFEEDNDLRYAADYYLSTSNKSNLITLLKRKYTLKKVSNAHIGICSVNWRRFYTTNYDKGIEISSANAGKVIECVDTTFPTNEYYKRAGLCVHLNGSIDMLDQDSLEGGFKLSTSSYISADSFTNSDWFYYFKKDLERSSAIVFLGYSLYDIEVQKILFENSSLREKTYFITSEDPTPKSTFTLSKYGRIVPVGIVGFSKIISAHMQLFRDYEAAEHLQALVKYNISDEKNEIRDANIETMLMYGDISDHFIDDGVMSPQTIPFLIVREELNTVHEFLKKNSNVVVFGDMGNGKSIFLRELKSFLSMNSFDIYDIIDFEGDYTGDVDLISNSSKKSVIVIDGYEKYMDLITHYCGSIPDNINIIASARTSEHERMRNSLKDLGFLFYEVNIDSMSLNESSKFVDIIDNIGMWGEKAGLSHDGKIRFLQSSNFLQISLSLLSLFDSPQIKKRIASILSDLLTDKEIKETIFAIALLKILDLEATFSLISDVANNNYIYSSSVRGNENFKNLFRLSGSSVEAKSSLFCLFLIRNSFTSSYITNQLKKTAKLFNRYSSKDLEQDRIFKAMLKFSFIERLIPNENKKGNMTRYYEDLKLVVPWLKNDPHYWLQYGMAYITFKEYAKAQKFFDQAYALIAKRYNYNAHPIDAQQARLFILLAMDQNDKSKVFELFQKGHKLLARLENNGYKFKQVLNYKDFFEFSFPSLSKENKTSFILACQRMLSEIDSAEHNGEINISQQKTIQSAKVRLIEILDAV